MMKTPLHPSQPQRRRRDPSRRALLATSVLALAAPPLLHAQEEPGRARPMVVQQLGQMEGPLYFTHIGDAVWTGERILVAQHMERTIKTLDRDGTLLGRIGRGGQGPGEFEGIRHLNFIGGELVVLDHRAERVSIFGQDGRLIRTRPFPTLPPEPPLSWEPEWMTSTGGFVMVASTAASATHETDIRPVFQTDVEGKVIRELPPVRVEDRQVTLEVGRSTVYFVRPIHNATRETVSTNGRFYATVHPEGARLEIRRVDLETGEEAAMELEVPELVVPRAVRDSIAAAWKDSFRERGVPVTDAALERALQLPEVASLDYARMLDDGVIWLRGPEIGEEETHWLAVDPALHEVQEVWLPEGIDVLHREGQDLWGHHQDDYFVSTLVRLRLP